MIGNVALFLVGPVLLTAGLLIGVRAFNRNWRFGLRGALALLTLVALTMGAIVALVR